MSNICRLDIRYVNLRWMSYLIIFRGVVLEKVAEYLLFKQRYENTTNKDAIPDFQERIPPEIALEL